MGRHATRHTTPRTTPRTTRPYTLLAATLAAALLAACSGGSDDDATDVRKDVAELAGAPVAATIDAAAAGGDTGAAGGGAVAAPPDLGTIGHDVIVEMRVVLASEDVSRTVAAVTASAARLGGGVASSSIDYRGNGGGSAGGGAGESFDAASGDTAVLTLQVPPGAVPELLAELDDTATVRSMNQSAQDVTDQLVDLDVRIANQRASVATVRGLMDRATNLDELVRLEAEVTRRQTELEQLEAQQRNLADRVALATVTVEIRPAPATVTAGDGEHGDEDGGEDGDGVAGALGAGWDALAAIAFGIVLVLAATAPFLAVALLAAAVAWFVVRRRRAGAAASPPPVSAADRDDELVSASREG